MSQIISSSIQLQERIMDLERLIQAQTNWINAAVQSNKDIEAYLKSVDPTLPNTYPMPIDGVKHVIENLLKGKNDSPEQ